MYFHRKCHLTDEEAEKRANLFCMINKPNNATYVLRTLTNTSHKNYVYAIWYLGVTFSEGLRKLPF